MTEYRPEKVKAEEAQYGGSVVHKIPIPDPDKLSAQELSDILEKLTPMKIEQTLTQTYHHSHGQDTPFFAGLSNGELFGAYCPDCSRVYVTPRGHCVYDGEKTGWVRLKGPGKLHTHAVCYKAGEAYQDLTPLVLVYVEFENIELPDGRVVERSENFILSRLILPDDIMEQIEEAKETGDFSVIDEVLKIGMPVFPKFKRITNQDISDLYFVRAIPVEEED